MTDPVVVGLGQNKWIKVANTIPKTLYRGGDGSGYDAMQFEGADYAPAVGKKFTVLKIQYTISGTTGSYRFADVYEHTVAAAAGGTIQLGYYTPLVSAGDAPFVFGIDVYFTIAASNYINTNHEGGTIREIMWGIEEDV